MPVALVARRPIPGADSAQDLGLCRGELLVGQRPESWS